MKTKTWVVMNGVVIVLGLLVASTVVFSDDDEREGAGLWKQSRLDVAPERVIASIFSYPRDRSSRYRETMNSE